MTEQEAIELAKRTAEQEGWGWIEPVRAEYNHPWFGRWGGGVWKIRDDALAIGGGVRILIEDKSKTVIYKHGRPPY